MISPTSRKHRGALPITGAEIIELKKQRAAEKRTMRLIQVREAEKRIAKEKRDVYQRLRRESR
jgi:hypothetical protein